MADIKIDFELDGVSDSIKEISKLEEEVGNLNDSLKKASSDEEFNKLNSQLNKTKEQLNLLRDAAGDINLDEKFDDVYESGTPLTTQLGELEDRMYALAAAGQENSEGFNQLRDEAVRIRQTIIRVDESVDDLAGNRGIANLGEQFGGVASSLMALDFNRASKQAQGLAKNVSSIDFSTALKSLKQLGSTFINLGKALLTNPIFLIAGVIAGIVAAIVKLMDEIGLLKVITEALGAVFEWFGDIINDYVIQPLKDLTDWLGWTNNAEEELAEEKLKRAEKMADAQEMSSNRTIQALDNEIRKMKANGEVTDEEFERILAAEEEKRNQLMLTAKARFEEADAAVQAALIKGDLDEEELRDLKNKREEAKLAYEQSLAEIEIAEIEANTKRKERREKQAQEEQDARDEEKQAEQERLAEYQEYQQKRLDAQRQIEDLRISLIEDADEREAAEIDAKFRRLREDALANEELTQAERLRIIDLYNQQELQAEEELAQKIKEREEKEAKEKEAKEKKEVQDAFDLQQRIDAAKLAARSAGVESTEFEERIDIEETKFEEQLENLRFQLEQGNLTKEEFLALEAQAEAEHAQVIKGIEDEKTEYAKAKAAEELAAEEEKRQKQVQMAMSALGAIGDLVNAFTGESEEAQRRAFKVQKAVNLAQAITNTALAVTAALTAGGNPIKLATGAQFIEAGIAAASGAAQIATIAKTKFQPSGGGGGGAGAGGGDTGITGGEAGAGGVATAPAPIPPSLTMTGIGNELGGEQSVGQRQQSPMVKAIVVESDITDTQDRLSKYQSRSEIG